MNHDLLPKFDPSDPGVLANPYAMYARLREVGALCRVGPGQWAVTRYADVAALLADRRLGSQFPEEYHSFSVGDGPAREFLQRIILHQDRPHHTRMRRLMGRAFSPAVVRDLRSQIGQFVDLLLAPICDRGYLEAVSDLALPLPVMVVCEVMGIPADDRNDVCPRTFDLGRAFATSVEDQDRATADKAVMWLRDYFGGLLDRRRRTPGDDLLSRMLAAEEGNDGLNHEEIVDNAVFLFFAGFETSMSLIATGCAALLDYPDQLARLRADRSLVPTAVEEFLRFDAPIQSRLRLVLSPIEVGGRTIRPGRVVLLLLGSANHDERQFAHPEQLDIGRDPNPHLSFGGGIHSCLGATLARIEGAVVFDRLMQQFTHFEPAGDPVREIKSAFRTFAKVPIAVRTA